MDRRKHKKPTQILGNVRCPILVNQVRRCVIWLTDMKEKAWIGNCK